MMLNEEITLTIPRPNAVDFATIRQAIYYGMPIVIDCPDADVTLGVYLINKLEEGEVFPSGESGITLKITPYKSEIHVAEACQTEPVLVTE